MVMSHNDFSHDDSTVNTVVVIIISYSPHRRGVMTLLHARMVTNSKRKIGCVHCPRGVGYISPINYSRR